jgi:microsomal epoxide hydrolase
LTPLRRRTTEAKINSLPQFTAVIQGFTIHFVGVFSEDPNAIPLALFHGWPGSFYEFYHTINELRKSTSPSFHIIVPSLPGYTFSSPPPVDRDFSVIEVTAMMNELMAGLGLDNYIAVGGDIGAAITAELSKFPECRGIHRNNLLLPIFFVQYS